MSLVATLRGADPRRHRTLGVVMGLGVGIFLVVLGLISGISMPRDRMVLAGVALVALPIVGGALANIPAIGEQLAAVAGNLQMGIAGAFATALAIMLYELVMEGLMGMVGGGDARPAATAH